MCFFSNLKHSPKMGKWTSFSTPSERQAFHLCTTHPSTLQIDLVIFRIMWYLEVWNCLGLLEWPSFCWLSVHVNVKAGFLIWYCTFLCVFSFIYVHFYYIVHHVAFLWSLEPLSYLGSLWTVTEGFKGLSRGNAVSLLRAVLTKSQFGEFELLQYEKWEKASVFLLLECKTSWVHLPCFFLEGNLT